MRVALINPPWSFAGSIYFGCREPHLPLELGYAERLGTSAVRQVHAGWIAALGVGVLTWFASDSLIALAGGGLKTGQAVGVTDELGKKILDHPMSVPDMHATIHCALGINPEKSLYDDDRPVPITDRGQPARHLFS